MEQQKENLTRKVTEGNVHPQKSVLPENSDFYKPEDRRTTREKLQTMNAKEKAIFIAQYYGWKIVAIVAVLAIILYFVVHFAFTKDTVLNIMAVNAQDVLTSSAEADEKDFYDEFLQEQGIDTDDVEVSIDSSLSVVADDTNSTSVASVESMQVQLMAGTQDVMFADEALAVSVGQKGYLADLTEVLPAEVIEKYSDEIVYATPTDAKEERAIGIRLKDNGWIAKSGWYKNTGDPVISICLATQNKELAAQFVEYVLDTQP